MTLEHALTIYELAYGYTHLNSSYLLPGEEELLCRLARETNFRVEPLLPFLNALRNLVVHDYEP